MFIYAMKKQQKKKPKNTVNVRFYYWELKKKIFSTFS